MMSHTSRLSVDSKNAEVKRLCIKLEKNLKRILKNVHDTEARSVIENIFQEHILAEHIMFRPVNSVPLIHAIGTMEQVWCEIDDTAARPNFLRVALYALSVLTGSTPLVDQQKCCGEKRKSRRLPDKSIPDWYHSFVDAVSKICSQANPDPGLIALAINNAAKSDAATIAGHIAGRIVDELLADMYFNPWDSEELLEVVDSISIKWKSADVCWSRIHHLLTLLKEEQVFRIHYVCSGWKYVSWTYSGDF